MTSVCFISVSRFVTHCKELLYENCSMYCRYRSVQPGGCFCPPMVRPHDSTQTLPSSFSFGCCCCSYTLSRFHCPALAKTTALPQKLPMVRTVCGMCTCEKESEIVLPFSIQTQIGSSLSDCGGFLVHVVPGMSQAVRGSSDAHMLY